MKNTLKIAAAILALSTAGVTTQVAVAGHHAMKKAETPTIVGVAAGNENFSTLVSAVTAAGLVDTLNGTTEFTVFAPTNMAFDKIPSSTLTTLLQPENKAALTDILTYHVVAGEVKAADLIHAINDNGGYYKFETVNGTKLKAYLKDGNVVLKDAAGNKSTITATDIDASNGVVHVIDSVVMPSSS